MRERASVRRRSCHETKIEAITLAVTACLAGFLALQSLAAESDRANPLTPGSGSADLIFAHPVDEDTGSRRNTDSIRAVFSLDPVRVDTDIAEITLLPIEMAISVPLSSHQTEVTRYRATALRAQFAQVTASVVSWYKDLDQGIEQGVDFIGLRVPIRILSGGEVVVMPSAEFGVRRYNASVAQQTVHASFSLEARVLKQLFTDWFSVGAMGRVRYVFQEEDLSGHDEGAMGFFSFLLSPDQKFYLRVYAGIDHQPRRELFGLPTLYEFFGVGVFGDFPR
ncbi:MAG: hypothetical protein AB1540_03325 [Bdellovibrionota bacterium]